MPDLTKVSVAVQWSSKGDATGSHPRLDNKADSHSEGVKIYKISKNKLRNFRKNSPSLQTCIQSHISVMVAVDGPFHLSSDKCGGLYS